MGNWDVDSQRDRVVALSVYGKLGLHLQVQAPTYPKQNRSAIHNNEINSWPSGWVMLRPLSLGPSEEKTRHHPNILRLLQQGTGAFHPRHHQMRLHVYSVCWGVLLSLRLVPWTTLVTSLTKPVNEFSSKKRKIPYALLSWLRGARTQRINESCQ